MNVATSIIEPNAVSTKEATPVTVAAVDTSITANANAELPMASGLTLWAGQCSSAGVKPQNDDAVGISVPQNDLLHSKGVAAVICDGVSAAEAGQQAARAAVSSFLSDYYSTPQSWSVQTASQRVLAAINQWLLGLGRDFRDASRGYVCTFSAAIIKSCSLHLMHVGDGRVYLWRQGELRQLTRDHACSKGSAGEGTFLTRALGLEPKLEIDYSSLALQEGDAVLLMTDGIHGYLSHNAMVEHLVNHPVQDDEDCEHLCRSLVELALAAGSDDNLSCQYLKVASLPSMDKNDLYLRLSSKPFPPPMSLGQSLDGYRVRKVLHESERSQVYLVQNPQGQLAVMKTPSVNYIDDAAYIERFMQESWIGSRIRHQNVVALVDHDQPKSALYYLTEYLNGQPLDNWLAGKKCDPDTTLHLVSQMEAGLRALHRREMVHRDLKPGNVMVCQDKRVKLLDFGSCYVRGLAEISTPIERDHILGTADYSAPELLLGHTGNLQSDLFSLAVITFEMLTGKLPFYGKLAECRTAKDFAALKYQPISDLAPEVPSWMDAAVRRALSINPADRYADTHEFFTALSTPARVAVSGQFVPLLQREPLKFFKVVCGIQSLVIIALLLALLL
ncbi:bifunctional protein-serine/threonine kinase/phosphatase [Shewanella avicenniae]|uniref:Bifunctional protein-serine/threonine kinase/phosphatase n=1 Tax=Shewanella avicenniae TaxID=2814294 RepID=A0ABX7QMZ4_9GAMM|nr:bifunctional protein-serine/threonine kinase/phosphatase [Shewanella avicenniae]QSX32365.1 bifunctional protein-serine/threonine kinase/phosphatase [Shewanella avicenniae]